MKRVATTLVAVAMGATALATAPAYAAPVAPSPSPGTDSIHADNARKAYTPDPRILSVDVDPNVVVVSRGRSAQVTARVTTKDVQSVDIDLWSPRGRGDHGGDHWFGKRKNGRHDGPKFDHASRSWSFDYNDRAGTYRVHVEAIGLDGKKYTADRSFTVKRNEWHSPRPTGPKATRIAGFDATPNPVRKGRTLFLKGRLQVAFDGHGRWQWLGSQDVKVYFQSSGSHRWQYVDTVETEGDGDFAAKVRAWKSGTWAVRFDGSRGLKGSEATDYVKVWHRW
ncbi:hypothetical protein ACQPZZ_24165 [Microbispora sp. CA-135349]|uniref:hypothetical protein n=1 Tax=Microbispora sp. CA-135349 TaxID=3239953 RepID=UPI003D91E24F